MSSSLCFLQSLLSFAGDFRALKGLIAAEYNKVEIVDKESSQHYLEILEIS